jgi:hypothetical protein
MRKRTSSTRRALSSRSLISGSCRNHKCLAVNRKVVTDVETSDADLDVDGAPALAAGNGVRLVARGARPGTILTAFAGGRVIAGVRALDPAWRDALLDDHRVLPYDLCPGVPKHRVPAVVETSGLTESGWVAVDPRTLETRFPRVSERVYVTNMGPPNARTVRHRPVLVRRLAMSASLSAP